MIRQYPYRCEAFNLDGFIAQVVRYVASGHYFYVTGTIPERKDPSAIDAKLVDLYDIAKPKWARARRRLASRSGMHYLRLGRFFVLLATHGEHAFFADHQRNIQDVRRVALHVGGYAIRYTYSQAEKRWKVFVRLDRETYRNVKAQMLELARQARCRPAEVLEREFANLPWQPYEPVRKQLLAILHTVNRRRSQAGLEKVSPSCVRKMRRIGAVFAEAADQMDGYDGGQDVVPMGGDSRTEAGGVQAINLS